MTDEWVAEPQKYIAAMNTSKKFRVAIFKDDGQLKEIGNKTGATENCHPFFV